MKFLKTTCLAIIALSVSTTSHAACFGWCPRHKHPVKQPPVVLNNIGPAAHIENPEPTEDMLQVTTCNLYENVTEERGGKESKITFQQREEALFSHLLTMQAKLMAFQGVDDFWHTNTRKVLRRLASTDRLLHIPIRDSETQLMVLYDNTYFEYKGYASDSRGYLGVKLTNRFNHTKIFIVASNNELEETIEQFNAWIEELKLAAETHVILCGHDYIWTPDLKCNYHTWQPPALSYTQAALKP